MSAGYSRKKGIPEGYTVVEEEAGEVLKYEINLPLKMPKSLSPSSAAEFKNCPQSFLFQYILGIKQPTTEALAKGTMCHTALENLFDLPPMERTLDNLHDLLRKAWREARDVEPYNDLFKLQKYGSEYDETEMERDTDAEREWGLSAMNLLTNYMNLEDPTKIGVTSNDLNNPLKREMWVKASLSLDPAAGATHHGPHHVDERDKSETFLVRGIVDRIDLFHDVLNGKAGMRIVDYKTGKAPNFKYSKAMNQKIADEAMWQLKIYALLLREMSIQSLDGDKDLPDEAEVRSLRLLYLTSVSGKGQFLDFELGREEKHRDAVLNEVHCELSDIWKEIKRLVDQQDPSAFLHCNRKFCFCHKLRPKVFGIS